MFTVVSLFSGAMGLDIGLEQTEQFKLLACVEKVPAFCQTIRRNRDAGRTSNPDLVVYEVDINELSPDRVMDEAGLVPGQLDLLIGGPPCQSFSTTGKRGTVQDPRGTLLWRFLYFIEVMQPKFFLMENVRGLMSAALNHRPIAQRPDKSGPPLAPEEMPGSVFRQFVADLHGDYRIDCFEVNAVNYGAPQIRERALFIGNRFNRLIEFPDPTHGMEPGPGDSIPPLFDQNAKLLNPFRTLRDALQGLIDSDPVVLDFSPRKKRYLAMIPPGGNWRCLPDEVAQEAMGKAYFAKGGRSGWWRRLSFDLPSPTIITMPNHAGTALCHPIEVRALSLRECARIQEFPDNWEFCGTTQEQYAQVGNAVPVRLGKVAGMLLASELANLYSNGLQPSTGQHPPCRVVYLKSHIRTRQWYKAGQEFVWHDGEDNEQVKYGVARTERRVSLLHTGSVDAAPATGKTGAVQGGSSMAGKKAMSRKASTEIDSLFNVLKARQHSYEPESIAGLLASVNQERVNALSNSLARYISVNLPKAIDQRDDLASYRTNPYVLLACANVMDLADPEKFADFLFNSKLYMGLETSFGKSVESVLVGQYPITSTANTVLWCDPPEKVSEAASLVGLTREQKALARNNSVWREIDKSCVVGSRRYMTSIKSGPNCINDTQVAGMTTAISKMHKEWMQQTQTTYPHVTELDIVVSITYGTDRTTNNKENQILAKLLGHGFIEEDRETKPGVLIDEETRSLRVYRKVGQDFWAFIGNPVAPSSASFVFLEVLISLTKALSDVMKADQQAAGQQTLPIEGVRETLEDKVNKKIQRLILALSRLMFPRNSLPAWVREDFSEDELFWLATAMTAFYDTGI